MFKMKENRTVFSYNNKSRILLSTYENVPELEIKTGLCTHNRHFDNSVCVNTKIVKLTLECL